MMLDRICVSTWSFHTLFETGRMQVLDFPELVADRYGVHNLEIVAPHFGDADPREVQARLDRAAFPHREHPGRYQGALGDAEPVVSRCRRERPRRRSLSGMDRPRAEISASIRCDAIPACST